jgi:FtsP/CotA-like multicopper oxidase with cupredoxin domain
MMNTLTRHIRGQVAVLVALLLLVPASGALAQIDGLTGQTTFNFTAKVGNIVTPDAASMMIWGYANDTTGQVQIPGPTLIVNQGEHITINLHNNLPEAVSIVFPGQQVTATGGVPGVLTNEVPGNDAVTQVTYEFDATEPGTYTYYSGSHADLQVEMGLYGAIIVRPATQDLAACPQYTQSAYGDCRSAYDYEFLILQSEMDMDINHQVQLSMIADPTAPPVIDTAAKHETIWFLNGRPGPDTLAPAGAVWMPAQPYNCLPRGNPGKRVLARMIGGGSESHPFHTHGNNFDLIARNGRQLESAPGASKDATERGLVPDLAVSDYTQTTAPGGTYDTIYTWTGQDLGFDIYGTSGHSCADGNGDDFDDVTYEYCPDHGKPLPVVLPDIKDLTFGMFYSGSALLGSTGALPPGEGGFNVNSGYFHIWHSHNERELTNNDIFPGGMLTFFIVEPPGIAIQ